MIIHEVEQNTPEWFALRAGMPTASSAKLLVTPTGKESKSIDEYAIKLANNIYIGEIDEEAWQGNYHTDRGHELEPVAALAYEMIYDCELKKVGFCTDDNNLYGMSPDRLFNDNGLTEFKCLSSKAHTSAIVYYKKYRKPPPDFIPQCQMQLFVSEREFVDLFYYHPKLPELRIRITPIKTHFEMLECQLEEVLEKRDAIVALLREAA